MISLLLLATFVFGGTSFAGSYPALDGVKDIKVIFDVRGNKVKTVALQLDLIHKTYYEANIRAVTEKPKIVVVFGGGAVKLISINRKGYSDQEKMFLDMIEGKLAEMAREGIRLEVCLFASEVHDVDPATIPEYIHRVDNGWISILGYQAQGYSLVAVF